MRQASSWFRVSGQALASACAERAAFCARVVLLLCLGVECAYAVPEDADQPIHIQAENAEIDQENQQVTYIGSVKINQGSLQVTAERMIVDYREQKVVRITATGSPAHYLQQLEAEQGAVQANASTIIYHTQDERIDLKGNANLSQRGNVISGDLIHYDIVAGKVDAAATDQQPVKMVLQPASRDDC